MRTRRGVLSALGCGVSVAIAGCVDSLAGAGEAPKKLARLSLTNLGESRRQFEIRVSRDGSVVHESAHRLDGDGGSVSGAGGPCAWMTTPGSYVVAARLEGGEWTSRSVDSGVQERPEYALVHVVYDGWNRERLAFFIEPGTGKDSRTEGPCRLQGRPRDG